MHPAASPTLVPSLVGLLPSGLLLLLLLRGRAH
jgi:hypothetical protein